MPVDHAPTFRQLGVDTALVRVLDRARITVPTPVQAAVLPDALAGRDILGRAVTGSGKMLAFGLPMLCRLAGRRSRPKSPRGLVVVPTRELAAQVRQALDPLADALDLRLVTVYGGTPYDRQIKRLRGGADIVVATPGRLQDLVNRGACRLDGIEIAVLDEADHLCDLGFFPAVSEIMAMTRPGGQRLLMSATLDSDVDRLVRLHLHDQVTHTCNDNTDQPDIAHHVIVAALHDKLGATATLLRANPRSIVFTRTRMGATRLAGDLAERGVTTVDLHGNLGQGARERNLRKFRTGQADVVVATDVAARGIHVDGVNVVVHYDLPAEQKSYLHRSGRTARAGSSGAVVIMATNRQLPAVTALHRAVGVAARHHDARTAPQPMTVQALALVVEPTTSTAEVPRPRETPSPRHQQPRGGRGNRRSQTRRSSPEDSHEPDADLRSTAARPRRAAFAQEASQGVRARPQRPGKARERPAERPAEGRPERHGDTTRARPATAGKAAGARTKARWTAAQRRAAARR